MSVRRSGWWSSAREAEARLLALAHDTLDPVAQLAAHFASPYRDRVAESRREIERLCSLKYNRRWREKRRLRRAA